MAAQEQHTPASCTAIVQVPDWLGFTLCTCMACDRLAHRERAHPYLRNGHGKTDRDAESIVHTVLDWWLPKTKAKKNKTPYLDRLATRFDKDNNYGYPALGNACFSAKGVGDGKLECCRRTLTAKLDKLVGAGMLDVRIDKHRAADGTVSTTRYIAPNVQAMSALFSGSEGKDSMPMLEEQVFTATHPHHDYPTQMEWLAALDMYYGDMQAGKFNTWLKENVPTMYERMPMVRKAMADELGVELDTTVPFSSNVENGLWHQHPVQLEIKVQPEQQAVVAYKADKSRPLSEQVLDAVLESETPALSLERALKDSDYVQYEIARFKQENAFHLESKDWSRLVIGRERTFSTLWLPVLEHLSMGVEDRQYKRSHILRGLGRHARRNLENIIMRRLDASGLDERIFLTLLFAARSDRSEFAREDSCALSHDLLRAALSELHGDKQAADTGFSEWSLGMYNLFKEDTLLCKTSVMLSTHLARLGSWHQHQRTQGIPSFLSTRHSPDRWRKSMVRWTLRSSAMVCTSI